MNTHALPIPRRRILLAGLSILASLVCNRSFAQAPNWRQFRRDDWGFVIEFPDEPIIEEHPYEPETFSAKSNFISPYNLAKVMEWDASCQVSKEDFVAEQLWDYIAYNYSYQLPGLKLADAIDIPGRYPTRHFIGVPDPKAPDGGGFMSSRNIAAGKRWISCAVISDRPVEADPLAKHFFDSLSAL